jgi:hypothetical protein
VSLEPHMEVAKAGIVDQPHPVFLALLHVDTGPWHVLWAFGGVWRSSTAAATTVNGTGVGDRLVTCSCIVRLSVKQSQGGAVLTKYGDLDVGSPKRTPREGPRKACDTNLRTG